MNNILTGYEISDQNNNIDIDQSIQSIQDHMYQRNPEKYGDFLETLGKAEKALKIMKIPQYRIRVELFRCVYYAMRLIDDVVDGDTEPPLSLEKRKKLLESILSGDIKDIRNPLYKALCLKIKKLSKELGFEIEMTQAITEIVISMNYDLERISDTTKTRNKDDLKKNFHAMDISGVIIGTAIIFGINTKSAINLIEPLGEASRIMYNLRDFGEDILAELINIPKEELELFSITPADIDYVKNKGNELIFSDLPINIKKWFQLEIERIYALLEKHKANMRQSCEFTDNPHIILKIWRNLILKKFILPKTYVNEIQERIPRILVEVSQF